MAPHEKPCASHPEVVERLSGLESTLYGSKLDQRGGFIERTETEMNAIKQDVKDITKNIYMALGIVSFISMFIAPILVAVVIYFLTTSEIFGHRTTTLPIQDGTLAAKIFAKQGNLSVELPD